MKLPPYRKRCGSDICFEGPTFQNYKSGQTQKIYKNVTDLVAQGMDSADASTLGTNGKSNITPLCSEATGGEYGNCGGSAATYDGTNYTLTPKVNGNGNGWQPGLSDSTPNPTRGVPTNQYAVCDALLAVTVTNGGTGYTDGDTMTVTLGFATSNFDESPTFKIKCTAGVIQSATMLTPGCVPVALTGLHAATGATGSGAVFNFTRQDAVKDWSACNQTGYAAAAARRQWHGRFPFNNAETIPTVICLNGTTYTTYEPYRPTPPQVKYLKISATASDLSTNGGNNFGPQTISMSVNPLSGVLTMTNSGTGGGVEMPALFAMVDSGISNAAAFIGFTDGATGSGEGFVNWEGSNVTHTYNPITGTTASGSSVFNTGTTIHGVVLDGKTAEVWSADYSTGTFIRTLYGPVLQTYLPETWAYGILVSETMQITGTSFYYLGTFNYTTFTSLVTETRTVTATLSNPSYASSGTAGYTSGAFALEDDANSLLAPWNVNDRKLMPLTTGVWAGNCVKVTRNEVQTNVVPLVNIDPTTWTDPNALIYDGSIRGAPNTAVDGAGNPVTPDDYFDPYYQDVPKEGGTPSGYGGWRGSGLPPRATQWTNTCEAWGLPIGRMRKYNLPLNTKLTESSNDGRFWVTKWVESCILLPSVDHARPYGADRTLVDWVAWRAQNGGLPCAEGFTPVVTYRFPSCPPFAGRLAITSVTDNHNGTVTIVADAPPKPIDETVPSGQSFTVDLCGATMTALASNLTVTTLTPATTFKVTAAYATVAAAKWVVLYGALAGEPTVNWTTPDSATHPIPHWYWQDTERKMQMAQLEWIYDLRTSLEASRFYNTDGSVHLDGCNGSPVPGVPYYDSGSQLHNADTTDNYGYYSATLQDVCKSFNPCCPWLIVLSGCVSDTPPTGTGVRYDFSTTIQLDERYGSKSQLDVSQAMVDPLFEQPLQCNDITFQIENQPGTCIPYRESRLILPGASSMTTPPDNGAGTGQNETPAMLVDYTEISPATNKTGNLANPPFSLDGATQPPDDPQASQPPCVFIPSGNFTTC